MTDQTGDRTDNSERPRAGADTTTTTSAPTRRRTPRWLGLSLAIIFGLVYAYDVWEAIGNIVGVSLAAQSLDTTLSGFGWLVLVWGIAMPVVVFALAFWIGRRRTAVIQALLYLAGLAVVAALALDLFVLFGVGRLIV
ncbi:hypothetical protein [Cryobacterium psychrophilum]|uniref:Uncharacterized protein n=1 Tax=Cryobacterium psychrophilum TaxID=41988 RepID=A0A4Y8KTC3_9MICO|nr:hypothetical protein [Cryobacterium psychrophilum]TDW31144.1 hypothetical protein EDD25_2941 [Cryobacterium psychrophilum]TFD78560.1 hypothetical protein E3T53_10275 [Cryobacterium psychrophilum]